MSMKQSRMGYWPGIGVIRGRGPKKQQMAAAKLSRRKKFKAQLKARIKRRK